MFRKTRIFLLLPVFVLGGCATAPTSVVPETTGSNVPTSPVSEAEAARLALLNNAAFLELAEDIGISRAQLVQAKQFPNPTLSVLFPLGSKQLEFASKFPLEALWLRPRRVAAAEFDLQKAEKTIIQSGTDLVRAVKLACADLRLAERQSTLANESADLHAKIAELAEARLRAGDVGALESQSARTDALRIRAEADTLPASIHVAREKLRALLGFASTPATITLKGAPALPSNLPDDETLLKQALATRPDLRAAEIAVEAAGAKAKLAEAEILTLTAVLDANGDASNFEAGPGLEATLPIFNQNQGGKALAAANLRKAARHYATVRDAIATEVRTARMRYLQAASAAAAFQNTVLPALTESAEQTESAYSAGNVSYLSVLDATRKLHETRVLHATAIADWQRAAAELEHSLGSSVEFLR